MLIQAVPRCNMNHALNVMILLKAAKALLATADSASAPAIQVCSETTRRGGKLEDVTTE